jgi:ribosomal protein S18 acetylase RimI-like enzyme
MPSTTNFWPPSGRAKFRIGVELMAETWRRQGAAGLQGMWVAELDNQIVATIALRARVNMRQLPPVPVEWLFIKALGVVRAMYALTALSIIDHPIAYNELYISDVAVRSNYQRRGVARSL